MAIRLQSTRNSAAVERRLRSAFRALHLYRGPLETFFEHGQWWVRRPRRDADDELYSVVDAGGYGTASGFDFERIE